MAPPSPDSARVAVAKTHKLFIGGAFPRSESGRTYEATDAEGAFVANVAMASRKDLRDAVTAARIAADGWAARTGYNRGQILYRMAEVLESRRHDIAGLVAAGEGLDATGASAEVDAAVDRLVWYAGWTDKLAQVFGSANQVAGPYFNVSTPEPVGIVGVLAPQDSSLLGLVSVTVPYLAAGDVVVVVASQRRPLPAVALAEVAATSDVPAGVLNVLTGTTDELAPQLAAHGDIDALDVMGSSPDRHTELQSAAAATTTRVLSDPAGGTGDWHTALTTARLRGGLELKTVWHPAGT